MPGQLVYGHKKTIQDVFLIVIRTPYKDKQGEEKLKQINLNKRQKNI